jgi:hypothetical protein
VGVRAIDVDVDVVEEDKSALLLRRKAKRRRI